MERQYHLPSNRVVGAILTVLSFFGSIAFSSQSQPRKKLVVKCYWQNFAEFISSNLDNRVAKTGCEVYRDSTHCDRTAPQMLDDAVNGKRDWERVISNNSIYTVSCKRNCKKILGPGDTYDVETDGKFMWVTIEMPDKKNLTETFQIFDISPVKEERPKSVN